MTAAHDQEERFIEMDPVTELVDKDIKTDMVTVSRMFKKLS